MINPHAVHAITVDAGGTLIYPHPSVGEVYAEGLSRHGIQLDPGLIQERFREHFQILSNSGPREDVSERAERERWRVIVQRTLSPECPADRFDAVFTELWDRFAEGDSWRLYPGARETMEELAARGYPLYLLSNADERFRRVFHDLGLHQLFSHLFISSEMGYEKPHPRIFEHVEEAVGVPGPHLLHVGDSAFHDGGARTRDWQVAILGENLDSLPDLLTLLPAHAPNP